MTNEALKDISIAIRLEEKSEYYNERGRIYDNYLGDYDKARNDFNRSIELGDYDGLIDKVFLELSLQNYLEAKKNLDTLIDNYPNDYTVNYLHMIYYTYANYDYKKMFISIKHK